MRTVAIVLILAVAALRIWLDQRQRRCLLEQRSGAAPSWADGDKFRRAVDGALLRGRIAEAGSLSEAMTMLALAAWGLSAIAGTKAMQVFPPAGQAIALGVIVLMVAGLVRRVVEVAAVYLVDAPLGLGRPSPGRLVSDILARLLAGSWVALTVLVTVAVLLEGGWPLWWLAAWLLWCLLTALDTALRPLVMSRLLYSASPLQNATLAVRIRDLLQRCDLRLGRVRVLDASRRTRRANASVHGLGRTKHIFLHDTLLNSLGEDEVVAVVAHEAGHAHHRHLLKHLLRYALLGLVASLAGGFLVEGGDIPTPEKVGLLALMTTEAVFLARPVMLGQSRRFEYEADAFAAAMVGAPFMVRALEQLYSANAGVSTIDPIYARFHASHPAAHERLERLQHREDFLPGLQPGGGRALLSAGL